jgi:cystathionine beta-synthase
VDFNIIDYFEKVTDKDAAIMTRRIPKEEGIFVGNSAGSALAGLLQMKDKFKKGDVVVIIFHDHGTRYMGKMFNDDWMRDRNFLEVSKPKAIDLVADHKNQKLLTLDLNSTVNEALKILGKYNISQIPVTDKNEYVGSINDSYIFNKLIDDSDIKQQTLKAVMQKPFPVVGESASIEDISKLITKDNNAVLLKDLGGNMHIITKHDIIQAVAKMSN